MAATTPRKPRRKPAIRSTSEMLTPSEFEQLQRSKREAIAYGLKVFSPRRKLTPEERELPGQDARKTGD